MIKKMLTPAILAIVLVLGGCAVNKPAPIAEAAPAQRVASAPVAQAAPAQQVASACVKHLQINVWEAAAARMTGVQAMIDDAQQDASGQMKPNRVSRAFWKTFIDAESAGNLKRATKTHPVRIAIDSRDKKQVVWQGDVMGGKHRMPMPPELKAGENLSIEFTGSALVSPVGGRMVLAHSEFTPVGCGYNLHTNAIEASSTHQATAR